MTTGQQKLGEIALPPVEASVEDSRQDNGQSWQAVLSEGCRSAKSLAPHPLSKVICAGQGELQREEILEPDWDLAWQALCTRYKAAVEGHSKLIEAQAQEVVFFQLQALGGLQLYWHVGFFPKIVLGEQGIY